MELSELVDPARTALLSVEMQRGVVGDLSRVEPLAEAVRAEGTIGRLAGLMNAARGASVAVVHCTVAFRGDRKGTPRNAPMLAVMLRDPNHMLAGSPSAEIVPELGPEPEDIVVARSHGMSPFTGTALDATLRSLGVRNLVVAGVSTNVAIPGTVIEAVNLGYRIVLPRDCIAGFPADYSDLVFKHALSALARITGSAEIAAAWQGTA